MLAANNGHTAVVRVLIDHGAQPDSTDKNLCTALHRSVRDKPYSLLEEDQKVVDSLSLSLGCLWF